MLVRDFIGPSIDTGFRISQYSTPRQMVVAIELALMLVNAVRVQPPEFQYPTLDFFYSGRRVMKGVHNGIPYPLFWLDMKADRELEVSEDRLEHRQAINTDDMKSFCENYFSSNSRHVFRSYIRENSDPYFAQTPKHHLDRINDIQIYWNNESRKRADEKTSALIPAGTGAGARKTLIEPEDLEKMVMRVLRKLARGRDGGDLS